MFIKIAASVANLINTIKEESKMAYLHFPNDQLIVNANNEFTQEWTNSLATFNSSLEGEYNKNKCTSSTTAITKNSFSPIVSVLYIKYTDDVASDELTFPFKLWGILEVRDANGLVTQTKHLEGVNNITITNINASEIITGVLTKGA